MEALFVQIGFYGSFAITGQILDLVPRNINQPIIDITLKRV